MGKLRVGWVGICVAAIAGMLATGGARAAETNGSSTGVQSIPPSRPSVVRESQEELPVPGSPEKPETRLTKNWTGDRKTLSNKGIDIGLIYKGEVNYTAFGGAKKKETEYLGNVDIRTSFDGDRLFGWKGGSFFIYLLDDHGGRPSLNVGDIQRTSNIETSVPAFKLYEAWVQQILFEERFSLLVGLHDLNSEFYVTESSGLFFNSSFGVGYELAQTGVNGPSIFPNTAPAIRVRVEPSKSFYLQSAVFSARAGNPNDPKSFVSARLSSNDGQLLITEAAYFRGKENPKELYGKYGVGVWSYTRPFDNLNERVTNAYGSTVPAQDTSHGAYALVDQEIVKNRVSAFIRYGVASQEVNPVDACLGTGVVFSGLVPGRSRDRFGLAMARATYGREYREKVLNENHVSLKVAEISYEFNYRFELIPGIALQPDFQYVVSPGMRPDLKNAFVAATRFEVNF